jgi:hypothetical protein
MLHPYTSMDAVDPADDHLKNPTHDEPRSQRGAYCRLVERESNLLFSTDDDDHDRTTFFGFTPTVDESFLFTAIININIVA